MTNFNSFPFPQLYTDRFHISQLEAINVLVVLKTLVPEDATSSRVLVKMDNSVTMHTLTSG